MFSMRIYLYAHFDYEHLRFLNKELVKKIILFLSILETTKKLESLTKIDRSLQL